jgi:hypothetical protein
MTKLYTLALFCLLAIAGFAQPAGWNYTQPYQVTNNAASLVTNYQAKLTINTQALIAAGEMQADGDDIRFGKNCSGSMLYNYWIESGINTASTVIWVRIDSLYPSAARTIYMFYGNAIASGTSTVTVFNGPFSATDSTANTQLSGSANAQRGFHFAPTQDVLMIAVGKNEPSSNPRTITLFDFSSQAILTQQQVGGPSSQWSYQNIPNPIWLTQSTEYLLEIFFPAGDDAYYYGASPAAMNAEIQYIDMRYCNGCTPNTFPTNPLSGMLYGYVDMWYMTKTNVSPAPTITIGNFVTASAGNDVTFCLGDSVMIGDTVTGGTAPYSYSWSSPGDLSDATAAMPYAHPAATTTFTVIVTDATGCVSADEVLVTAFPAVSITATTTADSICAGSSALLSVTGADTYNWQPGNSNGNSLTVMPASSTTYTVVGTDLNGCKASSMTDITVNALPSVGVTSSVPVVCAGQSPVTLNATGASTYNWMPGNFNGASYNDMPGVPTTYTVVGTDINGCNDTAFISVMTYPVPTITASANDSICDGECVTLAGTANGGTPGYSYVWTPVNATTQFFFTCPSVTTCYTVTVTDANGCFATANTCIAVSPLPSLGVTGPSAICDGDSAVLVASGSNVATVSWTPSGSLSSPTGNTVIATPGVTTMYMAIANSTAGCADTTYHSLTVNPLPTVSYTSSLDTMCTTDGAVTLTGGSPSGGMYSGPGVSGTMFTPAAAGLGSHTLMYSYADANGCTSAASANVVVDACVGITESFDGGGVRVYPNPFTTVLTIERTDNTPATIYLFDIQGKMILTKPIFGQKLELDLAGLPAGVYSLQVIGEKGVQNFKVVKD